ncbi:MAG: AAA family ATPase, partial [Phycisphaerae bacterium]
MWISRVDVIGFGCLSRCGLEIAPNRANLVLAPNEAGKSTLLAAIETALYGLPSARTREGRELRERFTPWSGGASRITLTLRDDDHTYRIEHHILDAAGTSIDRATVYRDHQEVTDEMRREAASPGDWLFRIGRDDFRRSVLVRQGDLEAVAADTAHLVQHLESVATSTHAECSATAAQDRLAEALEEYRTLSGLDHWAQSHLAHARQWPRVRQRLEEVVRDYENQRRSLTLRREQLAKQIDASERDRVALEKMVEARDWLTLLEKTIQTRDLQTTIDADDKLADMIEKAQKELERYEDVRSFPAEAQVEVTRLFEREAQLRKQLDAVAAKQALCESHLRDREGEMEGLVPCSVLADQVDDLRSALALFNRAVLVDEECRTRREAIVEELETSGCAINRLIEARDSYRLLETEERERLHRFELDLASLKHRREETERGIQEAARGIELIGEQRRSRRRQGLALVVGGLVAGVVIAIALSRAMQWGVGATVPATAVAMIVAAAAGAWCILSSRKLHASRYDHLTDEVEIARRRLAELREVECRTCEAVDLVASRQGLTREQLLAGVTFYLSHADSIEKLERADARLAEAGENVQAHQRQWASWLADVGQETPVERVSTESATCLANQVWRWSALNEELASARTSARGLAGEAADLRASVRDVEATIAATLERAGVPLRSPTSANELITREELAAARREFEQKAQRAADRRRRVVELEALCQRRLPDAKRDELVDRVSHLNTQLQAMGGSVYRHSQRDQHEDRLHEGLARELLTRLADYGAWVSFEGQSPDASAPPDGRSFADWHCDTLRTEHVVEGRARLDQHIERKRESFAHTWQEARAFLKEYAGRMSHIDGELRRVREELRRGCRFAQAVEIAQRKLAQVQSDSYERWSELLSERLNALLGDFLPDYELVGVSRTLAPVLMHRATQQTLDLTGIMLHLSRGAKDRLFLAVRLALSQVLGALREVHLPLLLDDPMANWDDAALARGVQTLGKLGCGAACIVVFRCQ